VPGPRQGRGGGRQAWWCADQVPVVRVPFRRGLRSAPAWVCGAVAGVCRRAGKDELGKAVSGHSSR